MANAFGGLAGHELRWLGGEEGKKRRTWTGDGESRRNGGGDICGHGEVGKEGNGHALCSRARRCGLEHFFAACVPGHVEPSIGPHDVVRSTGTSVYHAILLFAVSLCIYYTLEFDFKILSPITMLM
jgi:hypothetical protein